MTVVLKIRNPQDLTTTYDQIEIQRSTTNTVAGMADISTSTAIDTTTASDLSSGYTAYSDSGGTVGTHYYRFRYKNSVSVTYSSYSDIFLSGGSTLQTKFRRRMRDINSSNYFFSADDLDAFETEAVQRLWPITWFETYSDSYFVPDGTTNIFNFPVGINRINSVETVDSNGDVTGRPVKYQIRGKMIIFDQAPSSGTILRAWAEKMFTDVAEVPEIWDGHLINIMRLQAYETLEGDRNRYYKYNSIAKPEGGNLPSIDKIITRIEAQITRREGQLRRTRRPSFIKLV